VDQVTTRWNSSLAEERLKGFAPIQQRQSTMAVLESERAERHAKACGLRRIRSYAQWLVADDRAVLNEEIDCSAVFGVTASRWGRGNHGLGRTKG
jgi:hypothetical protein